MTKVTDGRRIAIVGGGPGGLTLARILQRNGADVRVYERDISRDARVQGATLDLHEESGLKALRKADLMGAFNVNYRPGADKVIVVDRNAKTFLNEFFSGEHGEERPEIDRGPLRNLLIDSLKENTVVWDSRFTSLARVDDSLRLEFLNGTTATADIVIAADGANSAIRPYITPIRPVYSGIMVVEGNVSDSATATPEIHCLLNGGKIFALGDGKTLFVISKGDGSLAFYTGHRADEYWFRDSNIDFLSRSDVLRWFRSEFSGWGSLWDTLFANADPPFIPRPQYSMPLDQAWDARPDMTMIGDAAHVMPPYAGEGVNMAMLDALELAENLLNDDFSDPRSAIAAYEATMRTRAAATTRMTLEQTASMHSPTAIQNIIGMFAGHIAAKGASTVVSDAPPC